MNLSTKRRNRIAFVAFLFTIAGVLLLHRQEWSMMLNNNTFATSSSSVGEDIKSSWKIETDIIPYMGNLTCPYEIAHYNIDSHRNFNMGDDEKKVRNCAKLRYHPYQEYTPPDPNIIFENLPNNATIYIVGDSISLQLGIDFLCYISSISENIKSDIVRKQRRVPTAWCSNMNECDVNYNGHSELYWAKETFRSTNMPKDIHVTVIGEQRGQKYLMQYLQSAKKGDIIVMNQGLHYMHGEYDLLLEEYTKLKSSLLKARDNGVHLLWRETNAAHFNTTDGYYVKGTDSSQQQPCVASAHLDANRSRNRSKGLLVPYMRSLDVPILQFWEASFLVPEHCHVGQGIDCLHYLQPGVTSFFTESLLKYIKENVQENKESMHEQYQVQPQLTPLIWNVTVIIPACNRIHSLQDSISSALEQTYPVHEVIIALDSGHENLTCVRASRLVNVWNDERVKFVQVSSQVEGLPGSPARVRRYAIENASPYSTHYAYLDDDDLWYPNKVQVQIEHMIANNVSFSSTDAAYPLISSETDRCRDNSRWTSHNLTNSKLYGGAWVTQKNLRFTQQQFNLTKAEPLPTHVDLNTLKVFNIFVASSVMVSKEYYYSSWDEDLDRHPTEDYSLWLKILERTNGLFIQQPLILYDHSRNACDNIDTLPSTMIGVNCGDDRFAPTCFNCLSSDVIDETKCSGDCFWWPSTSGGTCQPFEYHPLTAVSPEGAKSSCLRDADMISHPIPDRETSSWNTKRPYPDLASIRILHDLFSERVYSLLGHLNNSAAVSEARRLRFEEKCVMEAVPKKLHWVWFGSQLPTKYVFNIEAMAVINHGYEVYLWSDHPSLQLKDTLEKQGVKYHYKNITRYLEDGLFVNGDLILKEKNLAGKADYLRMEAVYLEGGIYQDTDANPIQPFDNFGDLFRWPFGSYDSGPWFRVSIIRFVYCFLLPRTLIILFY